MNADRLDPQLAARMSRVFAETTRRVEMFSRAMTRAVTAILPTRDPADVQQPQGFAALTAKLSTLIAAVERNTVAMRSVANLTRLTAAATVVRAVQASAGPAAARAPAALPAATPAHVSPPAATPATTATPPALTPPKRRRRTAAENARLDAMEFTLTPDEQAEDALRRRMNAKRDQADGSAWESLPDDERERRREQRDEGRRRADVARHRRRAEKRLQAAPVTPPPVAPPVAPPLAPGTPLLADDEPFPEYDLTPEPTPPVVATTPTITIVPDDEPTPPPVVATPPKRKRKRPAKSNTGPQTPTAPIPLTPREETPVEATEVVTFPEATPAQPGPDVARLEAEMAQAEKDFQDNEERLEAQRNKGKTPDQIANPSEASRRMTEANRRKRRVAFDEEQVRRQADLDAARNSTPASSPVANPAMPVPVAAPAPASYPVQPPPVVPPPPATPTPPKRQPNPSASPPPSIPVPPTLPPVSVPGGLPPVAPPPVAPPPVAPPPVAPPPVAPPPVAPPNPPQPPGGNPPNAPPGGNAPSGNVIPALIAALRANTDATIKNTAAMKGRGGAPTPPPRADATLPSFAAPTAATAGILSMVNAISPGAISTLTGSFQALAGEIGKNFAPYVYYAADRLQDLTGWVEKLDPALKAGLTRIIAFSTIGLGGLAVGTRVVSAAFGLATGAVRLFGGILSFIAAHPIVLTLGAITAGVITLTGQWENLGRVAGRVLGFMSDQAMKGVKAIGEMKVPGLDDAKPQVQSARPTDLLDQIGNEADRRAIIDVVEQPEKAKAVVAEIIGREETRLENLKVGELADIKRRETLHKILQDSFSEFILPNWKPGVLPGQKTIGTAGDAAMKKLEEAGIKVHPGHVRQALNTRAAEYPEWDGKWRTILTPIANLIEDDGESQRKIRESEKSLGALRSIQNRISGGRTTPETKQSPADDPEIAKRDAANDLIRKLPEPDKKRITQAATPDLKADVVRQIIAETESTLTRDRENAASLRAPLPFEGDDKRLATLHTIVSERRAELENVINREMASYQKVKPGAETIPSGTDQFGRIRLAAREQETKLGDDARLKALGPLTAIESKKVADAMTVPQGTAGGEDFIFPKLYESFAPPKPKFDPAKLKEADVADAKVASLEGTIATLLKLATALRALKPTADELIESLPADVQRRLRGATTETTWNDTIKQLTSETTTDLNAERAKLPQAQRADSDAARGTNVVTRVVEALQEVYDQESPGGAAIPRGTPQHDRVMAAQKEAVQDALRLATAEGVTIPQRAMQALEPSSRERLLPFKPPPEAESRAGEIEKRIATLTVQQGALRMVPNPVTGETAEKRQEYLRNFVSPINSRFTDATSFAESVQTQAFNVGNLEAANQLKILEQQLKEQEGANDLLKDLNKNFNALREAVGRLRFWEGP